MRIGRVLDPTLCQHKAGPDGLAEERKRLGRDFRTEIGHDPVNRFEVGTH